MSDCIDTVTSLMPSSSNFNGSDVQAILDQTIGEYFDGKEVDIEDVITAPFLNTATGNYLDLLHGVLYGMDRLKDESDDDYRNRLIFHCKDKLTVEDLRNLGCRVYAYVDSSDVDDTLTSRNTSLDTMYTIDCPSDDIEQLVKDNMICDDMVEFI